MTLNMDEKFYKEVYKVLEEFVDAGGTFTIEELK